MARLSYADIVPLVSSINWVVDVTDPDGDVSEATLEAIDVSDGTAYLNFRCTESGVSVPSSVPLAAPAELDPDPAPGGVFERVRGRLLDLSWSMLRRSGGEVDVLESAPTDDELRQDATVRAFERVRSRFTWDVVNRRWVARDVVEVLDFTRHLEQARVADGVDRATLVRMLKEVARADGQVTPEEEAFVARFSPYPTRVERAPATAPLTRDALGNTQPASRETMLLLSMALACCDEDIHPDEVTLIRHFRTGLGIAAPRAEELWRWAREFVLDECFVAIYADGVVTDDEDRGARILAKRLQLPLEIVRRFDARHRRIAQTRQAELAAVRNPPPGSRRPRRAQREWYQDLY